MSAEKNRQEAERRLETSKGDPATAKILLSNRRYAHSCFHAQQAGEKCVKALWYLADSDPWGHSIRRLIEEIPEVDTAIYKDLKNWLKQARNSIVFISPPGIRTGCPN
jgi:HEPN domain-containing protein